MVSDERAEPRIKTGSVIRDTESGRTGIVRRAPEGSYRLHALAGDERWEVDPASLVELTPVEALSARVAIANHWSRSRV
ncbi:MAG TPA: hypothetical protein VN520_17835 [Streptomyces sp.]|uniref:hypothetical protein n=1 Tax=Streptomyces sp. TaxID=1931 RepID=UPI002C9F92CF|nr:hypothetical protein [Streptomyces sp.]HWU08215.1 hypothetical protein [Streptomyces sp.]